MSAAACDGSVRCCAKGEQQRSNSAPVSQAAQQQCTSQPGSAAALAPTWSLLPCSCSSCCSSSTSLACTSATMARSSEVRPSCRAAATGGCRHQHITLRQSQPSSDNLCLPQQRPASMQALSATFNGHGSLQVTSITIIIPGQRRSSLQRRTCSGVPISALLASTSLLLFLMDVWKRATDCSFCSMAGPSRWAWARSVSSSRCCTATAAGRQQGGGDLRSSKRGKRHDKHSYQTCIVQHSLPRSHMRWRAQRSRQDKACPQGQPVRSSPPS
jgi:hypothetical protein